MKIRPYKSSDRLACVEIFESNVPKFFDQTELKGFESWLNACDNQRKAFETNEIERYFVIEDDDMQLVGCGGFYIPTEKSEASMVWGMVQKNQHKKGIGRKFLEFRISEILKAKPGCAMRLDTTQHSYGFFERMGFETVKITKNSYAPGLDRYDMVYNRGL